MTERGSEARPSAGADSSPQDYAFAQTALLLGIAALVLPALAGAIVYLANVGKDIGTLFIGSTVLLTNPSAIIASLWALWQIHRSPTPLRGRWRAATALILGILSSCVYVIGGLVFLSLLWSVLRHD